MSRRQPTGPLGRLTLTDRMNRWRSPCRVCRTWHEPGQMVLAREHQPGRLAVWIAICRRCYRTQIRPAATATSRVPWL